MAYFDILKKDQTSRGRTGTIYTTHGDVRTPAFLPIGTRGTVKAVTSEELKFWGADIILANTYHLWQRPGDALIYKAGGLHKFMNWKGPIFTDSGGFQVFSLAKIRKVMEAGVLFQFDLDGKQEILSPEKSVNIQANLGSDIALILDDFPGYPFERARTEQAVALTARWAERAVREHQRIVKDGDPINPSQKLWGIVQGASFSDLREKSARDMVALGFEGFAIGGVAVGEPHEEMMKAVVASVPHLPETAPKHLLGVGTPFDIVQAAARGCDSFDCVIPTREARHGKLYIAARRGGDERHGAESGARGRLGGPGEEASKGVTGRENQSAVRGQSAVEAARRGAAGNHREADANAAEGNGAVEGYETIDIHLEKFKEDFNPVDPTCNCYLCLNHTRAYLRHLFASGEMLGTRLATMHNLRFYLNLMDKIRIAITYDYFGDMEKNYRDYSDL